MTGVFSLCFVKLDYGNGESEIIKEPRLGALEAIALHDALTPQTGNRARLQ